MSNLNSKYDPKYHDIYFKSVFKNKIMKEAFIKHLEKERNSESFLFYFDVLNFEHINEKETRKEKFLFIYQKYFQEDSKFELNVNSNVKIKVK
jgi:hypothetical protein